MPYDYAVDMWSIGCTLYELYAGKILFTGDSNNQMLKNIMEIRGKMSGKLYRRGQLSHLHFDDMGNFISIERDKLGKVRLEAYSIYVVLRTRVVVGTHAGLKERPEPSVVSNFGSRLSGAGPSVLVSAGALDSAAPCAWSQRLPMECSRLGAGLGLTAWSSVRAWSFLYGSAAGTAARQLWRARMLLTHTPFPLKLPHTATTSMPRRLSALSSEIAHTCLTPGLLFRVVC